MAASPIRSPLAISEQRARALPRRLTIWIDRAPARTLAISQTGLTALADGELECGTAVALTLPSESGARSARLSFCSGAVVALHFDEPLSVDEFRRLMAYPERSMPTAASRSNR